MIDKEIAILRTLIEQLSDMFFRLDLDDHDFDVLKNTIRALELNLESKENEKALRDIVNDMKPLDREYAQVLSDNMGELYGT